MQLYVTPLSHYAHMVRIVVLEKVICAYLDELDGAPVFAWPPGERGLELRRLEASARSMLDGLIVWGRELRHRPEHERSPTILEHERQRSRRMADLWEKQIEHPLMVSGFHLPQITLACALRYQSRVLGSEWRAGRPRLAGWMDEIALRRSLEATEAQTQQMLGGG